MTQPIEIPPLTEEQKTLILANYDKMNLLELTRLVFNDPTLDGRDARGKQVRAFLIGENKTIKTTKTEPLAPLILTDAQKKMIEDMAPQATNCLEVARAVWNDPTVKAQDHRFRTVFAHYKTCYPDRMNLSDQPVDDAEYTPPQTLQHLVSEVNDMVPTSDITKRLYGWPLKPNDDRNMRALFSYIRIVRFKYQASQYERFVDRNLFKSTFFRFTHDKPDLAAEEQDQYISAAAETVNIARIERDLIRIEGHIEEIMEGDRESRGQFMPLVELINTTRSKLDQSKGRLKTLIDGLVEARSTRLKDRDNRNSSFCNLVEAWQKDEQKRQDMIDLGIQEKDEDVKEVGRIKSLDDMVAILAGQDEDEAGVG